MTPEEQFKVCKSRFDKIDANFDKLFDKLFEDNGEPCWQTKIDRNTRWIGSVKAIWVIVFSGAIATFFWIFKK